METLNKLTFNFNLRRPKAQKATPLYLVVKLGEKQMKMPTGIKVFPFMWDKKKQECVISTKWSDAERAKLMNVNTIIFNIKAQCQEVFNYLCSEQEISDIERIIRNSIKLDDMANYNAIPPKRTITATKLVKKAFEICYPQERTKASTWGTASFRLKKFVDYIRDSKKGDTPQNHLTQIGLNDYKEFLQIKQYGATFINQHCQLIARLINKVLCVNSEFLKYKLQSVQYVTIKDTRKKSDSKKVALTTEETTAIKSAKGLTEIEQEYRDVFVMQVETGVRYGDLCKLFEGEYKTTIKGEQTIYTINTNKEDITAAVVVTPTILALQEKYKNGFRYNDFSKQNNKVYYNKILKAVARKAHLKRVVEYEDAQGNKKSEMLCDIISSHFARHTFITMKLREGYTPAEVSKMSGHADTRMIEKVYEHLNEEDKALQVIDAVTRNQAKNNSVKNNSDNDTDSALIAHQARENFELKVENEINEFYNKANGKLYHLGFDIILPNGHGLIHKTSTPHEANALLLRGFPNKQEIAKIMSGVRVIDVVNERLKPLGVKYNEDYTLVRI